MVMPEVAPTPAGTVFTSRPPNLFLCAHVAMRSDSPCANLPHLHWPVLTGPDFVYYDEISFVETPTDAWTLTSAALLVGDGVTGNPDKDNVFYCKMWSPARALYWILEQK